MRASVTNLHEGIGRHVEQRPVDDVRGCLDACAHHVLHGLKQLGASDVAVPEHVFAESVGQCQPDVHEVT